MLAAAESDWMLQFKDNFYSTFLSCWYGAKHESEAMWKLYAKDTTEAVAVQTTVKAIEKHVDKSRRSSLVLRAVNYRDDYAATPGESGIDRYFIKRHSFKHEEEVRLLAFDQEAGQRGDKGVLVPASLDKLLQLVVISPYA